MCQHDEYEKALKALGRLISSNKRSHGEKWQHAYDGMRIFLERLDLKDELHRLKVVHVAGTKGKGSTCAMVENILRCAGYKTGLFTSPHLVDVRERIRIDGQPVSKAVFLEHFWWCYSRLSHKADDEYGMAAYFRFLTLVALRLFLEEGVDVAILEVGLGGRLDATNCVRSPVVCGVTALGFDHMDILGHTLPEIAREKAGIFKPGAPAITILQPPDAMAAMQEIASKVGTSLTVVPPLVEQYRTESGQPLKMRLGGAHQLQNASLAVALASAWESRAGRQPVAAERQQQLASGVLPAAYTEGIQTCEWPGRSHVVHQKAEAGEESAAEGATTRVTYFLDGAHTPESMVTCGEWFATACKSPDNQPPPGSVVQHVLVFNCMQERDPESLLSPLIQTLQQRRALPEHALFVVPDSSYTSLAKSSSTVIRDTAWQQRLASIWRQKVAAAETTARSQAIDTQTSGRSAAAGTNGSTPAAAAATIPQIYGQDSRRGAAVPSLSDTLKWLQRCAREQPRRHMQVLVTGSLYIVGDMLRHLGKAPT